MKFDYRNSLNETKNIYETACQNKIEKQTVNSELYSMKPLRVE